MNISKLKNNNGITLIEIIVTVVIAGILSAIAIGSLGKLSETSRVEETKAELIRLETAIIGNPQLENNGTRTDFGYVGDVGAMPANLDALVSNPGGYATWKGPYIESRFTETPNDFKEDAWGVPYTYSGNSIVSTGSGSDIVRKFGTSVTDFTSNAISGLLTDVDGNPPTNLADSITVLLTYPNGLGGTTTVSTTVNRGGQFSFSSIPIGNHTISIIYQPTHDTLTRYVTTLPSANSYGTYAFTYDYFGSSAEFTTNGFEILRPTGDGSNDGLEDEHCGDNWECVDEAIADDNATYVEGKNGKWKMDLYKTANHTATGTIDSIEVSIRTMGSTTGMIARTALRTNGVTYVGSDIAVTSIYTNYSTAYLNNPQTGVAWTWTEIDNIEIGVEMYNKARCTQVWLEVYYTY